MRREQKQALENYTNNETEIIKKISEIFYLSGSLVCEGKTSRQVVANAQRAFQNDNYLSFTYDARFFGLASSQLEAVYAKMAEMGYLQQQFNVKKANPVHLARKLSEKGDEMARKSLEDTANPMKGKAKELAAEVLSVTAVPVKISTAWGLYIGYGVEDHPREDKVVAGSSLPMYICSTLGDDSVDKLKK